ncbi:MAG: glycoside hydrolase 105 family protein, partial [Spirochaetaceae bacterium]
LPENHKDRKKLLDIFISLMEALSKFQDQTTGLWYQVLDKGNLVDNWLETSCTSLFVYAYAKGIARGILDRGYMKQALAGFKGMCSKTRMNEQ